DQVASSVAGAIEPRLRQSEIERASRKPAASLTAYDLYLRALAQHHRYTEEGVAEAVVLARQALAIDPSYSPAAALVGRCRGHQRGQGWGALSDEDIGEACRLARQAAGFADVLIRQRSPSLTPLMPPAPADQSRGRRVGRIDRQCLPGEDDRLGNALFGIAMVLRQCAQVEVVSGQARGRLAAGALDLGLAQPWLDRAGDAGRDLI